MKSQKARGVTAAASSCSGKSRFTLRGRKKKDGIIQGKLRIRSMPGAYMVLGVIVVVVGTALAVAGYWPYRTAKSSFQGAAAEGDDVSQTSDWSLGPKGLLSASLIHSERMKLLGPVIMGVGLFILICANTVLYENRDRETQMLLAQMRSVICSVSTAVPSADFKEIAEAHSMAKHYQWVSSLPAAHLNILCLQQLAHSDPLLQARQPSNREENTRGSHQLAIPQTEALHHQESEGPPSLCSSHSNSCTSSQKGFDTQLDAEHGGSTSINSQPAQLSKLSSCLVPASSMSTLVDELDVPAAQPRRCHSMSCRTYQYVARAGVCLDQGVGHGHLPAVTRRGAGSQVCLNLPKQIQDTLEEQTHRSWPQLDLGSGRRYLKLDNKEDSADKLDQLEQWDKSFGLGPFQ